VSARRTIKVDTMARVEGEGAFQVRFAGKRVSQVRLKIFEPPRFFEAFLRGRDFEEVPDIVARICGICPIAYQMSAVHALEQILAVQIDPAVRELRRLIYCGEWIESHALHVYLLHAPDFLGYPDGLAMARDHAEEVQKGLELKKIGNQLVALLGGREIHPISVCVGGFYRVPSRAELEPMLEPLRRARQLAIDTVEWVSTFRAPFFEQDYEFVALAHPHEYPFNEGRLVSNRGLDIAVGDYEQHFVEQQVAHSTALHSRLRARGSYLVGPLARYNLNFDRLPRSVQELARAHRLEPPIRNPFLSIAVRALELVFACEEALRIVERYHPPAQPRVQAKPRAGVGHGCSEAPRGSLYHRYEIDDAGLIVSARIVPPTSQNQKRIEEDLRELAEMLVDESAEELTLRCEQAIRNYDPCISCSTHFLKVTVERT
jgi:coenzyme F420-reducing hydrogenase alpha subunit